MLEHSAQASTATVRPAARRIWLAPLIGTLFYPTLIQLFGWAMQAYRESGNALFAGAAAISMLAAGSVPLVAARALILMRDESSTRPTLTRSLLYLMFAAPPAYVLVFLLASKYGMFQYRDVVWISAWLAAGVVLSFSKAGNASRVHVAGVTGLRVIHGAIALCLLGGFLAAHLINHTLALWSVELHTAAMEWLRQFYRSEWVEPVLLGMLLLMFLTGVPLLLHHSQQRPDTFRTLQMATGVYIGMFVGAHLTAVLGARSAGAETDWFFATGPNGLLDGRGLLIPYYILAVYFLVLHVACGLRIVLLKHGVAAVTANRALYGLAGAGLVVTALTAIAALGFHIQS